MYRRLRLAWYALRYPDVFASAPMVCKAVMRGHVDATVTVKHNDGRVTTLEYRLTKQESEQ